jgi:hypothetical protein
MADKDKDTAQTEDIVRQTPEQREEHERRMKAAAVRNAKRVKLQVETREELEEQAPEPPTHAARKAQPKGR